MPLRNVSLVLFLTGCLLFTSACEKRGQGLIFGGGPAGGTFQTVAEGVVGLIVETYPQLRMAVRRSGGSFANLTGVENAEFDLGLVYSGDLILAAGGQEKSFAALHHVRALAELYGASAQLAVLESSRIRLPTQLRGARIAVGNPGSGAALAAERYFRALDLWDKIIPVYLGYHMALKELINGRIEAVWELVGVPSEGLREIAGKVPLRLLHLQEMARNAGFFSKYPFYRPVSIPAGSYPGQDGPCATFEDSALLVGHEKLPDETVKKLLVVLVVAAEQERLQKIHPVLAEFRRQYGRPNADFPLHKGAFDFWRNERMLESAAGSDDLRSD